MGGFKGAWRILNGNSVETMAGFAGEGGEQVKIGFEEVIGRGENVAAAKF